ncbi:hypothetical protein AB4Z52_15775 [Rhizobium sp. 2YAF20]|uniref:hypothetical protein n=1 Tax=Rhizobium sp. 2YAF20 TaxID=3233027 RepID=UPI003F9B1ECF
MSDNLIWENVRSSDYYRSVLKNMKGPTRHSSVRVGMLGEGVAPNYQVRYADGRETTFRGSSHKGDTGLAASFKEANISRVYSFSDVQGLLKSTLESNSRT